MQFLAFLREAGVGYANFSRANGEIQLGPDGVRQLDLRYPDGNWIEINDATYEPTG